MNTTQKTPTEFDLAGWLAGTDQDDLTDRTHQTVTVYRHPALVDEAVGRVAALEPAQVGGEAAIGETVDQAALDTATPVVPVALGGREAGRVWHMVIGAPIEPRRRGGPLAAAELAETTRRCVQELLDDALPAAWWW